MDKGDDGVATSLSHITMGQAVLGAYEKVCVGTVKFGTRSTQVRVVGMLLWFKTVCIKFPPLSFTCLSIAW